MKKNDESMNRVSYSEERSPIPRHAKSSPKSFTLLIQSPLRPKQSFLHPIKQHFKRKDTSQAKLKQKKTKNQTKKEKEKTTKQEKLKQGESKQLQNKKQSKSFEKEKKRKKNYGICLKQLKPLNLQEQKKRFFQKSFHYNPIFLYPNIADMTDDEYKEMKHFEQPNEQYIGLALQILEKSRCEELGKNTESPLSQKETEIQFDAYIEELGIGEQLTYEFVENTIAATSVVHNNVEGVSKVLIGLPLRYTASTIKGVLNHEIGTHFLRKLNDRSQKWHKERKKFGLGDYLQTEEGFAALNQLLPQVFAAKQCPLLFRPALMYYCCLLASKLPFMEMFRALQRFQPDPQLRWKQCVRVKRGIAETARPCGMYKDQIYLMGAVEILRNRKQIDFTYLYSGKISLNDSLKLVQKKIPVCENIKLPRFLDDLKLYKEALEIIAVENFIK